MYVIDSIGREGGGGGKYTQFFEFQMLQAFSHYFLSIIKEKHKKNVFRTFKVGPEMTHFTIIA